MRLKTAGSEKDGEVAGLIREAREKLVHVPVHEKPIASVLTGKKEIFSIEINKAELDSLVHDLRETMTIPVEPVPAPQPLLGPLKTALKKMVLRVLRPFLIMTMTEQVEWNESAYETLKRMHESLEYLRQEVEFLNRKLDAYRLKKEDEQPES